MYSTSTLISRSIRSVRTPQVRGSAPYLLSTNHRLRTLRVHEPIWVNNVIDRVESDRVSDRKCQSACLQYCFTSVQYSRTVDAVLLRATCVRLRAPPRPSPSPPLPASPPLASRLVLRLVNRPLVGSAAQRSIQQSRRSKYFVTCN